MAAKVVNDFGVQYLTPHGWYTVCKDKKGFCLGWMYCMRNRSPRSACRVIRLSDQKVIEEIPPSPMGTPKEDERWWKVTSYKCPKCETPFLVCVAGNGMTPGGNPYWMCVQCKWETTSLGPPGEECYSI